MPTINMGGVFKGANSGQVSPTPKASADIPVKAEVTLPAVQTGKDPGYEAVRRAAQALTNTYAVSDVRFTIFKDIAGDYVTRVTSLRDGSVKYFPQKSLFDLVKIRNQNFEAMVDGIA